jgi:hypothetical protein
VIDKVHAFEFSFDDLLFPEDADQTKLSILLRLDDIDPFEYQLFLVSP